MADLTGAPDGAGFVAGTVQKVNFHGTDYKIGFQTTIPSGDAHSARQFSLKDVKNLVCRQGEIPIKVKNLDARMLCKKTLLPVGTKFLDKEMGAVYISAQEVSSILTTHGFYSDKSEAENLSAIAAAFDWLVGTGEHEEAAGGGNHNEAGFYVHCFVSERFRSNRFTLMQRCGAVSARACVLKLKRIAFTYFPSMCVIDFLPVLFLIYRRGEAHESPKKGEY